MSFARDVTAPIVPKTRNTGVRIIRKKHEILDLIGPIEASVSFQVASFVFFASK